MRRYFQYICKKVPFRKVSCIEGGWFCGYIYLTAASGWCAIRSCDMKSAAVGWWLELEWCCGGMVRLVM